MATMKDIARIAQVSTSTVSHVINNSRFVSDEIRTKVLNVVQELNYTPSALARSLKVKETKTIGLLVTATNNPFFTEVVSGVEQYCNQHNYNLILSNTEGNTERLRNNLQTLIQKQVDGLLLMCSDSRIQIGKDLNVNLPFVIMDWWPTEESADKIFENSEYGGYLATKALIDKGHRHIAIITGNLKKSLAHNRLNGYKRALAEANIPLRSELIIESHFDFEGGMVGMEKVLAITPRPTAVFACSDSIAFGAYQTIWRQGLTIPQDISIIGYDNITLAQYMSPPLSTINQPKAELGKLAVETLLQRIKNPSEIHRTLLLQPELILRESIQAL
ncbi:substrate-binding domain-containing protein [Pasteurella canis]|uniref:Ribose operon repressor n=1 Tax=Pasteurella canis TaxID=753 RepID=A0ABQ4VFY4_9PAST|nr:substrate-binding domain-containing protein [Pasteurella canis]UEC22442.1 substrate-binding domain-containing protein [Pasteurella canis]GJH42912.1 ribose operon repressor [Pasteurella canis]SPY32371.1 ribose operon repressor [Pasteurella canis]